MSYSKQWSSATPGYLIFLLDQSGSMDSEYADGKTRSEFAALAINRVIKEICAANMNGDKPRDRVFISIITYNTSVQEIQSGKLSDIYANPRRTDNIKQKVSDGAGGLIELNVTSPVWVEAQADGVTNMAGAFAVAKGLIKEWVNQYPENPAPIIINASDGLPYDGASGANSIASCIQEYNELQQITTADNDAPLVFNVHIGNGNKCEFPVTENDLNGAEANFLYKVSSAVPEEYIAHGQKIELKIVANAKGLISNADAVTLIKFINFGSSQCQDRI